MVILGFLEANRYKLKRKFNYYLRITLYLYEFIQIVSVIAYVDVLVKVWSVREVRPHAMVKDNRFLFLYVMSWISYFLCSGKVSYNHVLLAVSNFKWTIVPRILSTIFRSQRGQEGKWTKPTKIEISILIALSLVLLYIYVISDSTLFRILEFSFVIFCLTELMGLYSK